MEDSDNLDQDFISPSPMITGSPFSQQSQGSAHNTPVNADSDDEIIILDDEEVQEVTPRQQRTVVSPIVDLVNVGRMVSLKILNDFIINQVIIQNLVQFRL